MTKENLQTSKKDIPLSHEIVPFPNGISLIMARRKDSCVKLLRKFLEAYKDNKSVPLSQIEELYGNTGKHNSRLTGKKLRRKAQENVSALKQFLDKKIGWTILSLDSRKEIGNETNRSYCLIEKNKKPLEEEGKKTDLSENTVTLPNGIRYVTDSPLAKMCLRLIIKGTTVEALQQALNEFFKKDPLTPSRNAATVISYMKKGLKDHGFRIYYPPNPTNEPIHPIQLIDMASTFSP